MRCDAIRLRFLSLALDTTILLLRLLDIAYLSLWHAHNAALPRRAGEDALMRRSVEIDYKDQLQ